MQEAEMVRQNRNPAIERMVAILDELEKTPNGLGLKRLAERTGVTRSTVYRILNSLLAHGYVRQLENTDYVLGARLVTLADAVISPAGNQLAAAAQPHLDMLAMQLGETSKVSIYDRGYVLVVAIAIGRLSHALHAVVGEHLPAHAGGGSKVLLASMPESELSKLLARPLTRFNERTIIDPLKLRAELARVRQQGYAHDGGEFSLSVNAYAAPILDRGSRVVGAISIPFLAGRDVAYEELVRTNALATAERIGADLS